MLEALVNGLEGNCQPSAFQVAQLAQGHAKKKLDELTAALEGHQMRTSHRTLIRHAMRQELEDRYHRLKPRIGHKRALVASAHTLVIRIYEVLDSGKPYQSPVGNLTPRNLTRIVRHHTRRLRCLHHWLKKQNANAEG